MRCLTHLVHLTHLTYIAHISHIASCTWWLSSSLRSKKAWFCDLRSDSFDHNKHITSDRMTLLNRDITFSIFNLRANRTLKVDAVYLLRFSFEQSSSTTLSCVFAPFASFSNSFASIYRVSLEQHASSCRSRLENIVIFMRSSRWAVSSDERERWLVWWESSNTRRLRWWFCKHELNWRRCRVYSLISRWCRNSTVNRFSSAFESCLWCFVATKTTSRHVRASSCD